MAIPLQKREVKMVLIYILQEIISVQLHVQVLHFGLVCSLRGCVYATIKQHVPRQRL